VKQTTNKNLKMLRVGLVAMLMLLIVQFTVGMYLNFYTKLPDAHPGVGDSYAPSIPWALAGHAGQALAVHVIVWILLTLCGIAYLYAAL
jgi:nitric oxide reductase large subunit